MTSVMDITPLFINKPNVIHYPYYFLYRDSDVGRETMRNCKIKDLINECFEDTDFPEYIPIGYAVMNFLKTYQLIDPEAVVNVMVDESSQLAKGHQASV